MDLARRVAVNLTRHPAEDRSPTWSPDGRALAFYSNRVSIQRSDIYTLAIDGGSPVRLTFNGQNNWLPSWSPDGEHIAFVINYGGINLMNADGSGLRALGYGFRPTWSPDGRRLVFYADRREDLRADLYAADIASGIVNLLLHDVANDWDPAWSPDGRWLAFSSARSANAEIYVVEACGADGVVCPETTRQLTRNRVADLGPAWSRDGRWLAFTSNSGAYDFIGVVELDEGEMRPLVAGPANFRLPAWRPLG